MTRRCGRSSPPRWLGRRGGVLPARPHRVRGGRRRHHGDGGRRRVQHDRAAGPHAVPRAAARRRLHGSGRDHRLHVLRRELPEPRAGGARRGCSTGASTTTGRWTTRCSIDCSTATTGASAARCSRPGVRARSLPGAEALGGGRPQRGRIAPTRTRSIAALDAPQESGGSGRTREMMRGSTTCA